MSALRRFVPMGDVAYTPGLCNPNTEWFDTTTGACVPFGGPNAPGVPGAAASASTLSKLTSSPLFYPALIGIGVVAFMMLKTKRTNPARRRRRSRRRR